MAAALVGRDVELATLRDLIDRSVGGTGASAALLVGDPGAGKSRLVAEACAASGVQHRFIVQGHEPERQVPLAAARGLLQSLGRVAHEGPRLGDLLAGRTRGAEGAPLEPVQLFEAAHRCVLELGHALVVIDDLQWVDPLSVALCHYLLRAAETDGRAFALVAASRPGDAASVFRRSAARLLGDRLVDLPLRPLDLEHGMRLALDLAPGIDRHEAARIHERAAGLPFWYEVLIRTPTADVDPPGALTSALETAGPDAAALLGLLAVAGAPTPVESLPELLGWSPTRVGVTADELIQLGLAVRHGVALSLPHDIVRDAVMRDLPPSLVRRRHADLAIWWERRTGEDVRDLRKALAHRRSAGLPCGYVVRRIVESPQRRILPPEDVAELFEAVAGERLESGGEDVPTRIARLAGEIGAPALALRLWTSCRQLARTPAQRAEASLRMSQAALDMGDRRQAMDHLVACRSDQPEGALLVEVDAHESELVGDSTVRSEQPMRRAVQAAGPTLSRLRHGEPVTEHDRRACRAALRAQFWFALRSERPDEMLRVAEQLALAADTPQQRLDDHLDAVLALRSLARYAEAERVCRSVRVDAVRAALPATAFHAGHLLARTLYDRGRLEEARHVAAEVVVVMDRSPVVVPRWLSPAWIRSLPHEIELSRGDWPDALRRIETLAASEVEPHFRLHLHLAVAHWTARLAGTSGSAAVAAHADAAFADADAARCRRCASELSVRAAQVYARTGRLAEARSLLERWDATHPAPVGQAAFWRRQAEALVLAGENACAVPLLRAVTADAHALGATMEALWAGLDLGAALSGSDPRDAADVLRQVAESAAGAGAESERQRALQALRRIGVRTWRPSPRTARDDSTGLTPRELEIARYAAAGASNPEIAEAMFLSRKTVERHMSNIFAKLGVRGRVELATRMADAAG